MRLALLLALALPLAAANTFIVIVTGIGGEPEYDQRFQSQAKELDATLRASGPDSTVYNLSGAAATKARFKETLDEIGRKAKAEDALALMLIGHGSFDGESYKFNMVGPDVSAIELAAALDRVPAARQLVVNMTSASGGARAALEKPDRVVITATRTGTEKNATVFARYWVDALRDPNADTDKNEVITALEAFRYAEQRTKQFYEQQKRILTEHAVLGENEEDRSLAGRFALLRMGSLQQAARDPAKQALLARREQIEVQISQLKLQKAAMAEAEYKRQLQALLIELARTQVELDK